MGFYSKNSEKRPQILGLASSLFSSGLEPCRMEAEIKRMEDILHSDAETASNVVSVLRYGTKPHEVVLECGPYLPSEIDVLIENEINNALAFLKDHRYDPNEIYEGFMEELQDVPNPTLEPEEIFKELLDVLHNLGPWSTDRAALVLLLQIEKLKVTTPYERHFLLLCMTSSVLVKIRAILDDFFKDMDKKERIYKFSSPKILRTFEILKKFQPEKTESDLDDFGDEEDDKTPTDENSFVCDTESSANTKNICKCNCEVIYRYLLHRLNDSSLSFNDALDLYKDNNKNLAVTKLGFNETEDDIQKRKTGNYNKCDQDKMRNCRCVNDSSVNSCSFCSKNFDRKTISLIQRKNGYVSMGNFRQSVQKCGNEPMVNGVNDNVLQCHEYLLLPKFRVDRYARGITQMKTAGRDDFIYRQIKPYNEIDPHLLCGLIFVDKKFTAKVLFHVLNVSFSLFSCELRNFTVAGFSLLLSSTRINFFLIKIIL